MISYWRSIDKISLLLCIFLLSISIVLISSVGTFIAKKIGMTQHSYFIYHHLLHTVLAMLVIVVFTILPVRYIKYIGIFGTIVCILLIMLLLSSDVSIKGAKRWITVLGFSLQPSEFLKPFFSIFVATFVAKDVKVVRWIFLLYLLISILILMEPDFGTYVILSVNFLMQLFFSSIPFLYLLVFCFVILSISLFSYSIFPHIKIRVHKFLFPENEVNFQVSKSLDALMSGGFFGVGPGEGKIKTVLPDAHTDFIFAVAVEEFGFLLGAIIIITFLFLIIRITAKIINIKDSFTKISVIGIVTQIFSQAFINLGVSLNLLPTKGMTLPLISYGGSSMIATAISLGVIFNLEKTNIAQKYIIDKKNHK